MNKLIDYSDTKLYIIFYLAGLIAIALFDLSAITDNIVIFSLISPVVAPLIGILAIAIIAVLLGVVSIFSDIFHLFAKR